MKYIPLTAFATAIVLGGSLSAAEPSQNDTSMKDQRSQSQWSSQTKDKSAKEHTTDQAKSEPMTASDVLGMNIDSADDEKIGEIDEIFIDSDTGEVLAVVVSTGGFLGMGQQQSLISPKDLRFNDDRSILQTDITKDQIESAPRYQTGETTGLDDVRPLSKTASNWDAQQEPQSHAQKRSTSGFGQTESNRQSTGEAHSDRTNRNDNARTETTGYGQIDSNRQSAEEEPTKRINQRESAQSQSISRGLAISDIAGMNVENSQGEAIGNVDEVFIDLEKRELIGVVVSTGGFLGMGDHKTLFGMREMSFDPTNEVANLDYNRDQIREIPNYNPDDQSVFADLSERLNRLAPRDSNYKTRSTADSSLAINESGDDDSTDKHNVGSSSDQGNSSDETAITASIRTALYEDDTLSSSGKNVTIITKEGKIVLRGEVDSDSEKTTIEGIAKKKAGSRNVTSELIARAR